MTTTLEATYEDGCLKLAHALPLAPSERVVVTIRTAEDAMEENAWRELSKAALTRAWDNPEDEVFNELLAR